jgi:hypothetical protein
VLIEEVDRLDPEPSERGVGDLPDVPWGAVEAAPQLRADRIDLEAELGGDRHLPAEWRERLAHALLIDEWAAHLRGVEEGDGRARRPRA